MLLNEVKRGALIYVKGGFNFFSRMGSIWDIKGKGSIAVADHKVGDWVLRHLKKEVLSVGNHVKIIVSKITEKVKRRRIVVCTSWERN